MGDQALGLGAALKGLPPGPLLLLHPQALFCHCICNLQQLAIGISANNKRASLLLAPQPSLLCLTPTCCSCLPLLLLMNLLLVAVSGIRAMQVKVAAVVVACETSPQHRAGTAGALQRNSLRTEQGRLLAQGTT